MSPLPDDAPPTASNNPFALDDRSMIPGIDEQEMPVALMLWLGAIVVIAWAFLTGTHIAPMSLRTASVPTPSHLERSTV